METKMNELKMDELEAINGGGGIDTVFKVIDRISTIKSGFDWCVAHAPKHSEPNYNSTSRGL